MGVGPAKAHNDIIIDNSDMALTYREGNWRESGGSNEWSGSSEYARDGAIFEFYFDCPADGSFKVLEWHSDYFNRSDSVQVNIESDDGEGGILVTQVTVNQLEGGGSWNLLGAFNFSAGNRYAVTIVGQPGPASTCADAIMFRQVLAEGNIVVIDNLDTAHTYKEGSWTESSGSYEYSGSSYFARDGAIFKFYFDCPADGSFEVLEWHSLYSTRSESVQVNVESDDGAGGILVTQVTVNQQEGGRNWNSLGEYDFSAGKRYAVTIIAQSGSPSTCADAIMFRQVAGNEPQQIYAFPLFDTDYGYFKYALQQIGATRKSTEIWRYVNNQGKEFIIQISQDDIATMTEALTTDSIVILAGHANWGSGHAPTNDLKNADGRLYGVLYADDPGLLKMTTRFYDGNISGIRSHFDPAWQPIYRSGESAIKPFGFFDPSGESPPYNYEIVYKIGDDPTCYGTGVERMLPEANTNAWFDPNCGEPDPTNPDHWQYFMTQPVFYKVGYWSTGISADNYGSNYLYVGPGSGDQKVIWETKVPAAGDYILYGWWPNSAANTTHATFTVDQPDGSEIAAFANVDQSSGGSWQNLGQFSISNPGPLAVILTDAADSGNVVADAVRIVNADNPAVFDQVIDNTTSPSVHFADKTVIRRNGPPDIAADQLKFKKLFIMSCKSGPRYLQQYTNGVVFYSLTNTSGRSAMHWLQGVLQGKSDYELWQIIQDVSIEYDYYKFATYPWEQSQ
jgi:hypothetical protein